MTLREQTVGAVREVVSEIRVDDSITTMGRTTKPRRQLLVLRGDVNLDYHFIEDQGRISDYPGDASEPVLFIHHPPTGLRKPGGWALGGLGLLILVGVVIELVALAFGKRVTTNLTEA